MAEPIQQPDAREQGVPERILHFAALIGGITLFLIMLLVSYSVIKRYALNDPLLGSQELVEIGMSVVVMLAMPYTALIGGHIRVDIFDNVLGSVGRFVCDLIARVLSIVILGLLVQKAWGKTLDAYEYEDVTNMLELPIGLAYGAIVVGMSFFILVLALQLIRQFQNGIANYE